MSEVQRSAVLSDDGLYRYRLDRWWGDGPRVVWVMLNPSTADADIDDPTIRRVMRFSREWGYDGCTVLNLWPFRATKPSDLATWMATGDSAHNAHVDNQRHYLDPILKDAPMRVAAWGAWPRSKHIITGDILAEFDGPFQCLGVTDDGSPRHPLYVRADTAPRAWLVGGGAFAPTS